MLDLSSIQENYLEVKLPDDSVIKVKTPSLRMKSEISKLPELVKASSEPEQEKILNKLVARILSRNTEDREITVEQVKIWFPEPIQNYIVNSYANFINEISQQKN